MLGVCELVLDISFIFFALNPLKRFRLGLLLFCARESILVYFWGFCVSFYFLRFSPLKRFRGTCPSFVLEKAFWLMLGTVFALFHSIFFAFATSIRISRVGVPPGLELGLARTL